MTNINRRRFPILIAAIAALALAMTLVFSPVQAQEGSAPDKPTGLSATATHDQVVLTWDDPDDDTITGYVILRRVRVNDTGGEFSVLVADTGRRRPPIPTTAYRPILPTPTASRRSTSTG